MKNLAEIKKILEHRREYLKQKYSLEYIAIFGSVGRQQNTVLSDVDIMVEFRKPVGIEFIDLANELEKILNVKVDLVSKNGIKPKYYSIIKHDLIYV